MAATCRVRADRAGAAHWSSACLHVLRAWPRLSWSPLPRLAVVSSDTQCAAAPRSDRRKKHMKDIQKQLQGGAIQQCDSPSPWFLVVLRGFAGFALLRNASQDCAAYEPMPSEQVYGAWSDCQAALTLGGWLGSSTCPRICEDHGPSQKSPSALRPLPQALGRL